MKFSVNGIEREYPLENDPSLGDLLDFVRNTISNDACCVSSIKVDGSEISENEEKAFAPLPLTELRTVEIFTAHPRELAEETLQNLILFTDHLSGLSQETGELFASGNHPSREFAKLIDGADTFVDALSGAKQILRAVGIQPVNLLEADMQSIMKDLLEFYQKNEFIYVSELLREHLPRNLEEWKTQGIPALIRARDS